MSYWADSWNAEDRRRLQIQAGDPAGQARVEAYTLLISIATWRQILLESQGSLAIIGDALGFLHDAVKLRAEDPVLNAIMGDLALLIAPTGMDIRFAHVWTQRNGTCDALSRLHNHETPDLAILREATVVKRAVTPRVLLL